MTSEQRGMSIASDYNIGKFEPELAADIANAIRAAVAEALAEERRSRLPVPGALLSAEKVAEIAARCEASRERRKAPLVIGDPGSFSLEEEARFQGTASARQDAAALLADRVTLESLLADVATSGEYQAGLTAGRTEGRDGGLEEVARLITPSTGRLYIGMAMDDRAKLATEIRALKSRKDAGQ